MHWEWLTHPITENGYTHFRCFSMLNHHQLQDSLRMSYPPNHWEWIHPFQVFQQIKSSLAEWRSWWWLNMSKCLKWVYPFSVMGWVSHSQSILQSTNVLLIFDIHDLNGALFLKISFLFLLLAWCVPVTVILPFTTIYTSL